MKSFKGSKLAFQISITILIIVLLITTLLLCYNYSVAKNIILKDSHSKSQITLELAIEKLDAKLGEVEAILNANDFFLNVSNISNEQINLFQETILKKNNSFYGTAFAFVDKNDAPYTYKSIKGLVKKNLNSKAYEYKSRDWFQRPLQSGQDLWLDPYFDHGGGDVFMSTYVVPLKKGEKTFALLTIDVTLEWLEKIISSTKIHKTGYAFLLNKDGKFIVHPNKDLAKGESLLSLSKKLHQAYLVDISQDIKNKKAGFKKVLPITTNKASWVYYAPLKYTEWTLALIFPEDELFRDLYKLHSRLVLISTISLTLLLVLIVLIVNKMTMPLRYLAKATKQISKGDFGTPLPQVHTQNEIGELATSFEEMRKELKHTIDTTIELEKSKHKIEHELNIAQEIQNSILTKLFPPFPNVKSFDIYALVKPAKEVGGDLFDFSIYEENKIFFAVGDVSGKGVPASLYMAITLTLFRALQNISPSKTLIKMNNELASNNPSMMFITFLMGVLDLNTGKMTLSNAGHTHPYILRRCGAIEELNLSIGLPLGVMSNIEYTEDIFILNPGDSILLYSDGVTDAQNRELEQYGTTRLFEELKQSKTLPPRSIVNKVLNSVSTFIEDTPQFDDITLEVISYYGTDGVPHQKTQSSFFSAEIKELANIATFIESFGSKNSLTSDIIFKINLAVDELFTNVVNYSLKKDQKAKIKLSLSLNVNEVRIILEDRGAPFDPTIVPQNMQNKSLDDMKAGGLGLHIVKELMSEVSYRRIDDTNVLIMGLII